MSERVNESEANAYHSKGATFTGNPRYTGPNPPIEEKPGAIPSDSLASESLHSGGSFASNQSNIAASAQPAKGFTGNTTDTSGATVLAATENTRARGGEAEGSVGKGDDAGVGGGGGGQGSGSGSGSGAGSAASGQTSSGSGGAAPSYARTMGGSSSTGSTSTGTATRPSENTNPSYAPHGKSIQEGNFDFDKAPNASFSTDIGGENDPGRVAETKMEAGNARIGEDSGYPGANVGKDAGRNQGGFERLGDDASA